MDGSLRYRGLQQWANTWGARRRLRNRLNPLEEYDDDNFRLLFHKRFCYQTHCHREKRCRPSNEGRLASHANSASSSDLAILCYSQLSSSNIGDLFGVSNYFVCKVVQRVSRAISKHKRQFISFSADFHATERSFYDIGKSYFVEWVRCVNNCKFYQRFHKT